MTDQPLLSEKPDIKLVVLDVDNTLLNSSSELSSRNEAAIKAVMEEGVQVVLATGKNYSSCVGLIQKLGLKTPGIYTQGLTIYEASGTLRHQQILDTEVARRVITFAEDRGFAVVAYAQDRLIARSSNPYIEELHTRWHEPKPQYVGPLQNQLSSLQINKLLAVSAGDERKVAALRWQLGTQLNGSARLMSAGIGHMLEILPPGGSKGQALRALVKEMRIDLKNVMAIGDAENDIEMLQAAGLAIAIGNATPALKAVADEVTATNDDNGVAKALEKHILGAEETPPTPEAITVSSDDALAENAATAPKPEDTPIEVKPDKTDSTAADPKAPRPEDMTLDQE